MTTRWYNTSTSSTVSARGYGNASRDITPADLNATTSANVAAASTISRLWWYDLGPAHNAADWPTTGFGYSVDIQSVGADITWTTYAERYSGDGSAVRGSSLLHLSQSGTGVKTNTGVGVDLNTDAARAASDAYGVRFSLTNASMMSAESWTMYVSDSQSWIENTNFTQTAAIPSGTGTGSYTFAGAPAGSRASLGTSTGSYTFAGSSAGEAPPNQGTSSGAYNFTGSATGDAPPNQGSTVGGFAFAGSSIGSRLARGSSTGAYAFAGSAVGEAPPNAGAATGAYAFAGSATGAAPLNEKSGTATGGYAFSGTAVGDQPPLDGTATGSYAFAGSSTGKAPNGGAASGSYALTGSAAGEAPANSGSASGSYTFAGSATGTTARRGTATGGYQYAGIASSSGARIGAIAGTYTFTGSATGAAPALSPNAGTASGSFTFSGSITGSEPTGGTASGATAWSGSASGSAAHEGSSTGAVAWAGTAAGAVPNVADGTVTGSYDFEVTVLGSRPSKGSPAASTTGWYGSASGSTPSIPDHAGSASGSFTFAISTTGGVGHRGLAVGWATFVGTAAGEGIDPTYPFQTPTYQRVLEAPLLTKRPRLALTESVSVVRINGTLQAHKNPTQELLLAAGVEGVDWFLGGREYQVSLETLQELQLAGF